MTRRSSGFRSRCRGELRRVAHGAGAGGGRRPKIAVPTRTIVAPSSMATSKSWLMPIESSREAIGRHAARDQLVAQVPQPAEPGARVFGSSGIGGTIISPRRSTARASSAAVTRSAASRRRRRTSCLRGPGRPGSAARPRPASRGGRIELLEQIEAVDRLNPGERRRGALRLVRLQMADEVPRSRDVASAAILSSPS